MVQLTRSLLEQYMRATGWSRGEGGAWTHPRGAKPVRDAALDVGEDSGASVLHDLGRAERLWQWEVAFRLGQCAVAEQLLAASTRTVSERVEERVSRVVEAQVVLRDVGVDLAAAQEDVGVFQLEPSRGLATRLGLVER